MNLLQLKNAQLILGKEILIDDGSMQINRGDKACLIGRNGAGKSTLLRALAGALDLDDGELALSKGVHVYYLEQNPDLSQFQTTGDYVLDGIDENSYYRAISELDRSGLALDQPARSLSGGEKRRAALAKAFAQDYEILLLDEPTNHLDIEAIERLENRLATYPGACLVISHDRRFLEKVTNKCFWLRHRKLEKLDKGFSAFIQWQQEKDEEDAGLYNKVRTQLKMEEHWLHRGVTARRRRNQGRLSRLMEMRAEQKQLKTMLFGRQVQIDMKSDDLSGKVIVDLNQVEHGFGEVQLFRELNLRMLRGQRLGIAGPNGAGKSTLIKIIAGEIEPRQGSVKRGTNLTFAYLDQNRAQLQKTITGEPDLTLWKALAPLGGDSLMVRGQQKHVATYAKEFLFLDSQLHQPVHRLSGGEQNRLSLAIGLAQPCNFLIMDEPTNDLDMETLELLTDAINSYDGSLILISHDRAFLDETVSSLLVLDGQGGHHFTPGGWQDYLRERKANSALNAKPKEKNNNQGTTKKSSTMTGTTAVPKRKKLSYMDARRLTEIEEQMPVLEQMINDIEKKLAQPNLYQTDPGYFSSLTQELAQCKAQLEEAEMAWLEIEEKRQ